MSAKTLGWILVIISSRNAPDIMSYSYTPYGDVYNNENGQYDDRDNGRQRDGGRQKRQRDDGRQPDDRRRRGVRDRHAEDSERTSRRELAAFSQPKNQGDLVRSDLNPRNMQAHQRAMRKRSAPPEKPYHSRRRLRQPSRSSSNSSSNSLQRRPNQRDRDQGAQSEDGRMDGQGRDNDLLDQFEHHFSQSSNGLIAAAAGAGLGAVTARQFGGNPYDTQARHQNWKTFAGAVVGAVAFNATANKLEGKKEKLKEKIEQHKAE